MEDQFSVAVKKAQDSLREEIQEKQGLIEVLEKIDGTAPLTVDTWKYICSTDLKYDDAIIQLVKNTFPGSTEHERVANGIVFSLYGFKCKLPFYCDDQVMIYLSWYHHKDPPKMIMSDRSIMMDRYFEALDLKKSWRERAELRMKIKGSCKDGLFAKIAFWVTRCMFRNPDRKAWEQYKIKKEEAFKKQMKVYQAEKEATHEKSKELFAKVIPVLKKFSDNIQPDSDTPWYRMYTLEKIAEIEGVDYAPER